MKKFRLFKLILLTLFVFKILLTSSFADYDLETESKLWETLDKNLKEEEKQRQKEQEKQRQKEEGETKALLSEYKIQFPGLAFKTNPARFYPDTLRLSHVLGYLRPVPQDLVKPGSYYAIDDIIGISGIEKVYENN